MNKFLNIISIFAVMFGTLGVQSGTIEEVSAENTKLEVTTNRTELVVVNAESTSEIVVSNSNHSCISSDSLLHRLDLLLWKPCDFQLKIAQLETPELVVIDESNPNATVSVARPEAVKFAKHSEISPSYSIQHLAYQSGLVNETIEYQFGRSRQENQAALSLDLIKQNMDNSQASIVLLC
ncbi:MAG TPA: hypothetical protein PKD34_00335 [Candidatus Doudnabacteria bacterium]|nr:hypothetical protein [Candidatus Doudnabacteria bacterium]